MLRTRSRGGILCPNSSVGLWAGDGVQVKWEPKRRRSQDGRQAAKMRAPIKQDQTASLGPRDLLFLRAQSWTGRPLSGARSDVGTDEEKMPGGRHGTDPTTHLGKSQSHTQHTRTCSKLSLRNQYICHYSPQNYDIQALRRAASFLRMPPNPLDPIPTSTSPPSPALACRIPVLSPCQLRPES